MKPQAASSSHRSRAQQSQWQGKGWQGSAVSSGFRGMHVGRALVMDSLAAAASLGFRILQFNAVVRSNMRARKLYEELGFHPLGIISGGFRKPDGEYEDICPYWRELI